MKTSHHRLLILSVVVFVFSGALAYQFSFADHPVATSTDGMHGTFLIYAARGHGEQKVTALVNPVVRSIGGKQFFYGIVSGAVDNILKEEVWSGSAAYVPVESVTLIQEVKTD